MRRNSLLLLAILALGLHACDDGGAAEPAPQGDGSLIVPVETDVPTCSGEPSSPCAADASAPSGDTTLGQQAPDFALVDGNEESATYGKTVALADYDGSVVVVYFAYST
jgi:hypothetical protein